MLMTVIAGESAGSGAFRTPSVSCHGIWIQVSKMLTLSQVTGPSVEVSNWANVSQSQGYAELIEMVQYL
jgi:hypothetical protein